MRSSNGYLVRTPLGTRRDPFAGFDSLVRTAFAPPVTVSRLAPSATPFVPSVESRRDGDDAVIRVELPGVDVERDVTVEVKGRLLVIAGERRDERSEDDGGRHLSEFRYGSFRRAFRLAPHVSGEAVSASYDAGVLTVRVAGALAEAEGHQVAITTGAPVQDEVTGAGPHDVTDES